MGRGVKGLPSTSWTEPTQSSPALWQGYFFHILFLDWLTRVLTVRPSAVKARVQAKALSFGDDVYVLKPQMLIARPKRSGLAEFQSILLEETVEVDASEP